jgi:hypothetical protein
MCIHLGVVSLLPEPAPIEGKQKMTAAPQMIEP